ncbi:MAG TPA: hypothetical protein VK203_27635 [Nostocaceae cyanobacterium]|nr:hypothetical protein [Nostocaceae cyanobacterium]
MPLDTEFAGVKDMNNNKESTLLLRLSAQSLKYFLLMLLGLAIAYLLSKGLGWFDITPILLFLGQHLLIPLATILLCLLATVIIIESWR